MTYQLINQLSESRAFRTRQKIDALDDGVATEFFYAYLLATIILAQEHQTSKWAQDYASRTSAFGNFDHFRSSGTDLYMLAFKLNTTNPNPIVGQRLLQVLRGVARLNLDQSFITSYLLRLERHLSVRDTRLKNIRRVLPQWQTTDTKIKSNYLSYLRRFIFTRERMSEIIPQIDRAQRQSSIGVGKSAAIIGASALAGLMLGLRYDPSDAKRFLKPIGESVDTDQGMFDIVEILEANPAVDHVISVDEIEDTVVVRVMSADGKIFEFQLRELDEE